MIHSKDFVKATCITYLCAILLSYLQDDSSVRCERKAFVSEDLHSSFQPCFVLVHGYSA